jgi:hypothetical protein
MRLKADTVSAQTESRPEPARLDRELREVPLLVANAGDRLPDEECGAARAEAIAGFHQLQAAAVLRRPLEAIGQLGDVAPAQRRAGAPDHLKEMAGVVVVQCEPGPSIA